MILQNKLSYFDVHYFIIRYLFFSFYYYIYFFFFFFFFQAEDGIRDFHVTGVQTCALPILIFMMASKSLGSCPKDDCRPLKIEIHAGLSEAHGASMAARTRPGRSTPVSCPRPSGGQPRPGRRPRHTPAAHGSARPRAAPPRPRGTPGAWGAGGGRYRPLGWESRTGPGRAGWPAGGSAARPSGATAPPRCRTRRGPRPSLVAGPRASRAAAAGPSSAGPRPGGGFSAPCAHRAPAPGRGPPDARRPGTGGPAPGFHAAPRSVASSVLS